MNTVQPGGSDFDELDPRDAEQQRYDALADQVIASTEAVNRLIATIERSPAAHTQTVIHRNEGMGAWGAAAVAACFMTYLSLIIFAVWAIFQINNLWAWKDIHAGRITRLESQHEAQHK